MKPKIWWWGVLLGILIAGNLIGLAEMGGYINQSDFKVLIIVDRETGEKLASAHIDDFYFATIKAPTRTFDVPYADLHIEYHRGAACEHGLDFRDNSTTRIGFEVVRLHFQRNNMRVEICVDNMPEFNTTWGAAYTLYNQMSAGARWRWGN